MMEPSKNEKPGVSFVEIARRFKMALASDEVKELLRMLRQPNRCRWLKDYIE